MSLVGRASQTWSLVTPFTVGSCVAWYDAMDSNSMVFTGSVLTTWSNKASNAGSFTGTSTTGPTYSNNNAVVFNGTTQYMTGNNNGFNGATSLTAGETIFIVATLASTALDGSHCLVGHNNTTIVQPRVITLQKTSTSVRYWYRLGSLGTSVGSTTTTAGTRALFVAHNTGCNVARPIRVALNGSNLPTGISNTTAGVGATIQLGAIGATRQQFFNGSLHELLFYSNALGTKQRQAIEGYLLAKWGLLAAAASTNPYKITRPFVRQFSPLDIPSCLFWLDAMDSTTITTTGSSVTQWNDKSGNNYHASGGVSPTITTNGVVFNGTTQYLVSTLPQLPNATNGETWFVVFSSTKTSLGDLVGPAGGNGRRILTSSGTSTSVGLGVSNFTIATGTAGLFGNRLLGTITINSGATAAGSASANTGPATYNTSVPFTNWVGATTNTLIGVGALGSVRTYWFGGTIHEIIGYVQEARFNGTSDTTMTYDKLRSVENYLIHKWGLLQYITVANDGAKGSNVKGTMTIQ